MTAVMPKGVEHTPQQMGWLERVQVMTAVMPKGVEHFTRSF